MLEHTNANAEHQRVHKTKKYDIKNISIEELKLNYTIMSIYYCSRIVEFKNGTI